MGVNRFTQREVVPIQFYTPPLEVIGKALQLKQETYLRNFALADQLSQQQIQALTPDQAKANQIIQGYQRSIDDIVNKYEGDYSRISKDLYGLARQIRRDFSPGGEAYAIQSNYSQYQDWIKRNQDLIKSKVIRPEQLNLASNYILSNYKGIGKINPLTQTYNQLPLTEIVPYVDIQKKAMDAAKEVVAQKGGYETWTLQGGYIWGKKGNKWEKVSPERITDVVIRSLSNSPEVEAYLSQSRMFGYDPLSPERLESLIYQGISTYAYSNNWSTSDIKFDPLGVKQIEEQIQEQNRLRYMPTMDPANQKAPMGVIDLLSITKSKEKVKAGEPWRIQKDLGGAHTGPWVSEGEETVYNKSSLEEVIYRPEFKNKYGEFGVKLYENMRKAGQFDNLNNKQAFKKYVDAYNEAYEINHRQPLIYSYGAKTMDKVTKEIGSMLQTLTFDYVHPDGKIEENLTLPQLYRVMKGKWFNPSQSSLEEFQASMLKGEGPRITGLTQAAGGVNVGHIMEGPGMKGYAIVRGYDATWDNEAKPLLELSSVAQSVDPRESSWVLLPNSTMEVKAVGTPTFDPLTGKYKGTDTQFQVRFIDESGNRTQPVVDPTLTLEQLQQWVTQSSGQQNIYHKTTNQIQF